MTKRVRFSEDSLIGDKLARYEEEEKPSSSKVQLKADFISQFTCSKIALLLISSFEAFFFLTYAEIRAFNL